MNQLISLFESIDLEEVDQIDIEFKHFFSGAAIYADGKICMTLTPAGFALKLARSQVDSLLKTGENKRLRYFPNAPVKKDYVVVSDGILNDNESLGNLMENSIKFVSGK